MKWFWSTKESVFFQEQGFEIVKWSDVKWSEVKWRDFEVRKNQIYTEMGLGKC